MKRFLVLFMVIVFLGCGSGKERGTEAQRELVEELIENRTLEFEALWALPLTTQEMNAIANAGLLRPGDNPNRINLIGNDNYLRIKGDTVSAYLPYYGTQQLNVQYNPREQGIQFNEEALDLIVEYNDKKDRYEIRFSASKGQEGFIVFLTVFPNMSAILRVNSSSRNFIGYEGKIRELKEPES